VIHEKRKNVMCRILIVDDSSTTRAVMARILRMAGLAACEIFEAVDGQAALDFLATSRVDLILADLNMPRMDGVEMIRRMDADPLLCGIPVIVVSAEPNAAALTPLRHASLRGHIRKPFTPEEIKKAINEVLGVTCA
jgi:two-component system, chemotaxis family, chemotaxis protein CheY